ncbi:hypothetical protein PIB30_038645 [Stylosanthes scabra]|uniref:Aminotransferase-like plant mobile domain-containing protein n=1 Tax=Stylosanthes scabra TaxID=79078 RepID=A0ABU6WF28_9FABA|nr:hypothetical protein [Stylosanthes scabra]
MGRLKTTKWFTTNEFWKSYLDTFSKLPVPKPRYLLEGLISEDKYEVFWKLVDLQGLRPLLHMKERYYPRMMRVVATTLQQKDSLDDVGNGEFYLRFWIAGTTYTITLDELATVWGLQNDRIFYKGGNHRPKEYDFWSGADSQDLLNITYIGGGKYSVGEMSTDHRLLHYMLSYLWLPRKGNHGVLTEDDTFVIGAMVKEVELNWPYLIAHRLMRYTDNSWESHLGHGMLWTKIFEYFNLDLSGEEAVEMGEENEITARHVNKMGRGAVAAKKGKKSKADAENVPSQSGTSLDSQITSDAMDVFAGKMHAFNIDWDKKMERVDKRLKVVEGRIASQAEGLQYLEESMNTHFSRRAQSGV